MILELFYDLLRNLLGGAARTESTIFHVSFLLKNKQGFTKNQAPHLAIDCTYNL